MRICYDKKRYQKKYILSSNLKNNLKLRKTQLSDRDKSEIDGKRLDKIGVAKLDFKEKNK